MIDTHCHLTFPEFESKTDEVLARAAQHGVTGCITISTTTRDCLDALAIAKRHANVWCTAGVHPCYSDDGPHEWSNVRLVASDAKCVAWGELGLDNHYTEPVASLQRAILDEQLAFIESCRRDTANPIDKPVVIHCREAFDDLIPVLKQTRWPGERFVFHCFTGTVADIKKILDFGAFVSFTGVATYKNAAEVREAAAIVPADRIMCETDAPFLSPEPHRGSRPCEPWMSSVTAKRIAEARNTPWPEFHAQINANTKRFFGIDAK